MREVEDSEIKQTKCLYCGARNKIVTNILQLYSGKHIGYSIRCCNCGLVFTFISPEDASFMESFHSRLIQSGTQKCVKSHKCDNKNCVFYNTTTNESDCGDGENQNTNDNIDNSTPIIKEPRKKFI